MNRNQRPRVGQIPNLVLSSHETGPNVASSESEHNEQSAISGIMQRISSTSVLRFAKASFALPFELYKDVKAFAEVSEGTNIGVYMQTHPEKFSHTRKEQ